MNYPALRDERMGVGCASQSLLDNGAYTGEMNPAEWAESGQSLSVDPIPVTIHVCAMLCARRRRPRRAVARREIVTEHLCHTTANSRSIFACMRRLPYHQLVRSLKPEKPLV